MMNNKTFLCIIPARGGSKSIPNKNIIDLNGHPLIYYCIEAAKQSNIFNRIIVSTDSVKIAEISKKYGIEVPFLRPSYLATDDSMVSDTLCHAVQFVEKEDKRYDYVCLLQPTSPLLEYRDIRNVQSMLFDKNTDMIVSVGKSPINIAWVRNIPKDLSMKCFASNVCGTNKQDFNDNMCFLNGAIYFGKWDIFYNKKNYYTQNTYAYIMPYERSIDIDSYVDLKIVEYLMDS